MADAWRPTSELERRLQETVRAGDQEGYFRVLGESELVIPVPPDLADEVLADRAQATWPVQEEEGRTHVLAYTSAAAMRECLGPAYRHFLTLRFSDLAETWPDARWWLAVDAPARGADEVVLPIESRLPAWFIKQVVEGDSRPPKVGRGTVDPLRDPLRDGRRPPAHAAGKGLGKHAAPPVPPVPPAPPVPAAPPGPVTPPGLPAPFEAGGRDEQPASPPARTPSHPQPPPPAVEETGVPGRDGAAAGPPPAAPPAAPPDAPAAPAAPAPLAGPGAPAAPDAPSDDPSLPPDGGVAAALGADTTVPPPDAADATRLDTPAIPKDATEPPSDTTTPAGGDAAPWEELQEQHRDLPRAEPRRPEFRPANDVERALLRAAANNDHDLFLQTLADAEVLLPIPEDMDYLLRPGRPGFPWQAREIDGASVIPLFTSRERLVDAAAVAGTGTDYITLPFTVVLRYWPDRDRPLAINSGSPAGGTILAEQLPGLATWADQRAARRMSESFEPQNDVEQRLFDAALRRDTDAFFKVLLGAQVLVPAEQETPWGITPDDAEFPWRPVPVHGKVSIQLFTSLKWMTEAIGTSRFVMPSLLEMVSAWPDTEWTLVLNPGTPIDATMPGEQVRALSGPARPGTDAERPPQASDAAAAPAAPPPVPPAAQPEPRPQAEAEPQPLAEPLPEPPQQPLPEPEPRPQDAVAPVVPPPADLPSAPAQPADVPAAPEPEAPEPQDVPAASPAPPAPTPTPTPTPTEPIRAGDAPPEVRPAPPPEAEFEPGNRIDQDLYEAALAGDSDAFLRVLLAANVLVPIPADAPLEVTPVQREFRWEAALRGDSAVQVFTSLVRLREVLPESRFVYADFRELIGSWPRADWAMLLNPGTRIGASLRGEQVQALSEWAVRVGLVQPRPEVPPAPPAPPAPAQQPYPSLPADAHTANHAGADTGTTATDVPLPAVPDRDAPAPQAPPAPGHAAGPVPERPAPVPLPEPEGDRVAQPTIMQKVVSHRHVDWYLEQGYDRVGGFVHPISDVAELQTPIQLYEALGLLYEDSPFQPGDQGVHVIRWPGYCPDLYRIPFGGQTEEELAAWGEDGWVIERAPFHGGGFAPGSAGSIREYKVDSVRLPFGAEMYYLGEDRSERFVAMYDPDRLAWLRPETGTGWQEGWEGQAGQGAAQ
ncbi:SseB family protein [Spirillospora sp. CA-255316]